MVETSRSRWLLDLLIGGLLLSLFLFAVRFSSIAYSLSAVSDGWLPWWDGFLQNSGTEMLGAFLTFILLEVVRGSREKKAQEQAEELRTKELKDLQHSFWQAQELFRLRAAETFVERQPILDNMIAKGMLQGADLNHVDLQGARFSILDPQTTEFLLPRIPGPTAVKSRSIGANLEGANLYKANLQQADLTFANL